MAEESRLRVLLKINQKLGASLDAREDLGFILDSVRTVVPYDSAEVCVFNSDSGTVSRVAGRNSTGLDPSEVPLEKVGGMVGKSLETGEAILVERMSQPEETTRSRLIVPIVNQEKVLGAFKLESNRPDGFNREDLEWMSVIASQAAISLAKAAIYQGLLEKRRLGEQLRIARDVQLSLLPTGAPTLSGLDLSGINIPSEEIGGDYFDFIPIVEGHLGIVIADVVGKGIPASLIMASFRAFLRAEIRNNYAIRTIFAKVNNLLKEWLKDNQFVSAFYGVLDIGHRRLTYSSAGHHPAILLRDDGRRRYLSSGGPVLGILAGAGYNERFIDLLPGDILVLYTDGVVETESAQGEVFDAERLETFVRAHAALGARELCELIYAELSRFSGRAQPEDDTTIVIAKVPVTQ
jgi:sigma-B regulation protein RsbU (phosphoserine phosphatase)